MPPCARAFPSALQCGAVDTTTRAASSPSTLDGLTSLVASTITDLTTSEEVDDGQSSPAQGAGAKRKRAAEPGKKGVSKRSSGRVVCRNCGAQQTPQWRCGPEGPRTLCNACGVRYKKGLPLPYWEAKKRRM